MIRNFEIDTLRGLACIMLVSFHVAGAGPDLGLNLPETHDVQRVNLALGYLRMPLFSFLSGYIYAHRPFQGHAVAFVRGKALRLLLPMLTLGTFFALLQSWVPGANSSTTQWQLLHIIPVAHFWFLEALFIIFLLVMGLEKYRLLSHPLVFSGVLAISVVVHVGVVAPSYFALNGAVFLLPFFLAGLACQRFEISSETSRVVAALALVGAALWLWMPWETHASPGQSTRLPGLLVGVTSAFLLLRSGWHSPWLAYMGGYSFAIYLLHVFFTAGSRIGLRLLDVTNTYALLLLGTALGIAGPIAAAMIIGRSARWNRWLLGNSPPVKNPPGPARTCDADIKIKAR